MTPTLIEITTAELDRDQARDLRVLLDAAWGGKDEPFDDEAWEAAQGGTHFLLVDSGVMVAHGAVVVRRLDIGSRPVRTGYVEAVATHPKRRRRGHASQIMMAINRHIDQRFELGALDAAVPALYERLGWRQWLGQTAVRTPSGVEPTPEEEGNVFVRLTPASPATDLGGLLLCDWRPGEVW